jgi:hypothetical protein
VKKLFPHDIVDESLRFAMRGDIESSIEILNRLLDVFPNFRTARIERGRLNFKLGSFDKGIQDFEFFYNLKMPSLRNVFNFSIPNNQLLNKTVIIVNDSGLGDLLQFVRYGILLKQYGANVIIECQSYFFSLFENVEWIDKCVEPGSVNFHFNYRVPLHYLFGAFNTSIDTIPAFNKYLVSDQSSIDKYGFIRRTNKLTVGISWRSSNENSSLWTIGRKIDLKKLIECFDKDLYNIVLLQKELNKDEQNFIISNNLQDCSQCMSDINQTAAILTNCDIVVSTCTMLPHLSAALGIPTIVLLSTNSCWRWLCEREDSPWYPSIRLIRQKTFNCWDQPLNTLRTILTDFKK